MTLFRGLMPVAGATRRFPRRPAHTAVTPDRLVFCLSRPLHVTAPDGTIVNCTHPAAVRRDIAEARMDEATAREVYAV